MQGYKVKEKTVIVPPVSKLCGHPAIVRVKGVNDLASKYKDLYRIRILSEIIKYICTSFRNRW